MEGIYALLRKIIRNQKKIIQEQKKQTRLLNESVQDKRKISKVAIDGETGEITLDTANKLYINGKEVAAASAKQLSKEDLSGIGKGIVKEIWDENKII